MNDEIKNVSLSFCCDKDWKSMRTVDEQRKFCESCKLNVIDFTKANADQFKAAMQSSSRVCGRFKRSQMSESFLKYAASVVVASSISMSCSPVEEPTKPEPAQIDNEIAPAQPLELEEYDLVGIVISTDSTTTEIEPPYINPDSMVVL